MLQDALVKHLKSDDPITPLPVAPPPAQFMDSNHYDKVSMHADDQSLGTLPRRRNLIGQKWERRHKTASQEVHREVMEMHIFPVAAEPRSLGGGEPVFEGNHRYRK